MAQIRYEGEAVTFGQSGNIRPQGQGTITYLDGAYAGCRYEGDFLGDGNGHAHGQGRWYRPDGTLEYEGEWQQGEYHGHGKSYLHDGTTIEYEGVWKDSERHGQGILYNPDGSIRRRGWWACGKPIDDPEPSESASMVEMRD